MAINYRSEIPVSELEPAYFTAESSYLRVNDTNLHVRMRGTGEHVLLIHGSFSSLHTWEAFENELLKYHFQTISVDLPGHGLTGPNTSNTYTTDYYANLMFTLVDSLGIDSLTVVGNSMGGNVALKMALAKPARIKSLVLVNAAAFNRFSSDTTTKQKSPFIFKMLQVKPLALLLTRITPRFLFNMNLKEVYGNPDNFTDAELDRYYYLLRRTGNREATMQRMQQPGRDIQDSLQYIHNPTLILWGEKDRWIPVQQAYKLHQLISASKLIIFEDAGHIPMEEIPLATADSTLQFLRNNTVIRK
jgi:pimeloyl-ACP methyl ester carboxylesterase